LGDRVERLVTGQLVGAEEAVLAVAWGVVVEDLPNLWEAEAEAEAEEGEEEVGSAGVVLPVVEAVEGEEGDLEDFEVAEVVEAVEAVEGEGEEEVGSAGVVPEQHVVGLVGDHCDRGEVPGWAQEAVLVAELDWGYWGHWHGHWPGYARPDYGPGLGVEVEGCYWDDQV
jgi:hypothetical protein